MRKAFISYARANKPEVDQLVEHLTELNCQTWVDSSLHGGQDWWQEILRRIADCDVFIPIISREALDSAACAREFDWAEALGKPVLPVALEMQSGLPRRYSCRQIVDYSNPEGRDRSARRLGGGLLGLPPAPSPPNPLPRSPAAPLSYLTDLVDLVSSPRALDHDQQRQVLVLLDPAIRSVDPEERRGGRSVLDRFGSRPDLFADVDRTVDVLKRLNDEAGRTVDSRPQPTLSPRPGTKETWNGWQAERPPTRPLAPPTGPPISVIPPPAGYSREKSPRPSPAPKVKAQPPHSAVKQSSLALPATMLLLAAIAGAIPPIRTLSSGYDYDIGVWYWQTVSRIITGISFCVLASNVKSVAGKSASAIGWLMAPIIILYAINDFIVLNAIRAGTCTPICENPIVDALRVSAYPALLALTALIGTAFGIVVFAATRVAWAAVLTVWGLCGLVEALLSLMAKVDEQRAAEADSVLILLNVILLVVAILMYRRVRPSV